LWFFNEEKDSDSSIWSFEALNRGSCVIKFRFALKLAICSVKGWNGALEAADWLFAEEEARNLLWSLQILYSEG